MDAWIFNRFESNYLHLRRPWCDRGLRRKLLWVPRLRLRRAVLLGRNRPSGVWSVFSLCRLHCNISLKRMKMNITSRRNFTVIGVVKYKIFPYVLMLNVYLKFSFIADVNKFTTADSFKRCSKWGKLHLKVISVNLKIFLESRIEKENFCRSK